MPMPVHLEVRRVKRVFGEEVEHDAVGGRTRTLSQP
jgi:hypothetical protein